VLLKMLRNSAASYSAADSTASAFAANAVPPHFNPGSQHKANSSSATCLSQGPLTLSIVCLSETVKFTRSSSISGMAIVPVLCIFRKEDHKHKFHLKEVGNIFGVIASRNPDIFLAHSWTIHRQ
jgi:hypothetical protein